ncbi:MMPL family transporter [Antrihabitans spumae]|uniref:MMPL family transporter n=1 Tax=Antrihabitans spumae TaxID=3373370 RepID=A0ABW7KRD6_9NOCA
MLNQIARLSIRAPKYVLAFMFAIAILCGVAGATVMDHLGQGGFEDPDAESTRASQILDERFGIGAPNLVLLVDAPAGLDTAETRSFGNELTDELRASDGVSSVQSYWEAPPDLAIALRSTDSTSAIIAAKIDGDDKTAMARAEKIADELSGVRDGITVRAGGEAVGYQEVTDQVTKDLLVAEAVAIPITGILLVWIFGSLVAAMLPLAIGIFSILTTVGILRGLSVFTDMSFYALNMTTALGMALAIDYSLFMVSRFREELQAGHDVDTAIERTVRTAGRTVLFSALPVMLSMSALLIFPLYFLRSFAYAGMAVVGAAAVAALVLMPAILKLLGTRVNALDLRTPALKWFGRSPKRTVVPEESLWYRIVMRVNKFPAVAAVAVIIVLLFLGAPFLSVQLGFADDRAIGDQASSRQVGDSLRTDFNQDATASALALLPDFTGDPGPYAQALSEVDGVVGVASAAGTYVSGFRAASAPEGLRDAEGTFLTVATKVPPFGAEGGELLERLRAVPPPAEVLFTGPAAKNDDTIAAIAGRLPLALAWIALAIFVVLFLFTGSIVLPIKAIVVNTLSLSATFGALVWIFQEGHLSGLLGFTPTGYLNTVIPVLMFCLAFGMSMDYEIFILSRIREEWLKSSRSAQDSSRAVALGMARTGRIITAAAILMAVVLSALVTSQVSFIQMFGLGLALMVVVDATLVRSVLVPAFMQLMGRYNWWAPAPLARLHDKIGLSEAEPEVERAR